MCCSSVVNIQESARWNKIKTQFEKKIKTLNSLIKVQISYKSLKSLFFWEHIDVCISFV